MSCCGGHRRQISVAPNVQMAKTEGNGAQMRRAGETPVYFQYTGHTGLTAAGGITGRRYRFDHPGATVAVDGRDAASLAGIPNLSRLRPNGR